jgi:hypothetical protein
LAELVFLPELDAFEAAPLVAIPPAAPISAQAVATETSPTHRLRAIQFRPFARNGRLIAAFT